MLALFLPLGWDPVTQFIPAVVSLGYLVYLWWTAELSRVEVAVLVAWFMVAMALQIMARTPWVWIAGFVGQVALIIALVLKNQFDNVF